MTNDSADGRDRPRGARFHHRVPDVPAPRDPGPFQVVLRGYERSHVDSRLRALVAQIEQLRAEADGYHRRWRAAEAHVAALQGELSRRSSTDRRSADVGVAAIADKVLRHARMEAARIRAEAVRDARSAGRGEPSEPSGL